MLIVYSHYKYFYSYIVGMDFRRQILTSKVDSHAVMVNHTLLTASCSCSKASIFPCRAAVPISDGNTASLSWVISWKQEIV